MPSGLNDDQARALDVGRHLAVRANAGSGKTHVLTMRYIWLVVRHKVDVDQIVAITFTKKAAAEMRSRIAGVVQRLLSTDADRGGFAPDLNDGEVRTRLEYLRDNLIDARISTFHAYCAGLLKRFGHLIDIDPESAELTSRDTVILRARSVRRAIRERMHSDPAPLFAAYELMNISSFEALITSILRSGEQRRILMHLSQVHATVDDVVAARSAAWREAVREILAGFLQRTIADVASIVASGDNKLAPILEDLSAALQQLSADDPSLTSAIAALLKVYTKGEGRPINRGATKPYADAIGPLDKRDWDLCNAIDKLLGNPSVAADAEHVQARLNGTVIDLVVRASEHYEEEKRRKGAIDFDDMIHGVLRLLRDSPDIRAIARSGLQHMLVDEFQDTDPLQYEILRLLIPNLDGSAVPSAELFIVGDDKQSIYSFRGADVRVFERAAREMAASNSGRGSQAPSMITLSTSYRMVDPLAQRINALCRDIFVRESEYDVEYNQLLSARVDDGEGALGTLNVMITTPASRSSESDDSALMLEARNVAAHVAEHLQGKGALVMDGVSKELRRPEPGDIAILMRTNPGVEAMAAALQDLGIPFQAHGGRAFFSRPEVMDIRNLLRFCVDHDNALALAAMLRSPLFLLTDADLATIALHDEAVGFSWKGLTTLAQSDSSSERVTSAFTLITELMDLFQTMETASFVRKALERTGWYRTLVHDPRREQALANVDKLLDQIRSESAEPGATMKDVLDAIDDTEAAELEPQSVYNLDTHVVQVMTLHASKGLEFRIVYLAGISTKGRPDSYVVTDTIGLTIGTDKSTVRVDEEKPIKGVNGPSHIYNRYLADSRGRAEDKRLLYVGLTRAEDHVVLSLLRTETKNGVGASQGLADLVRDRYVVPEPTSDMLPPAELPAPYATSSTQPEFIRAVGDVPWQATIPYMTVTQLTGHDEEGREGRLAMDAAAQVGSAVHDVLAMLIPEPASRPTTSADVKRMLSYGQHLAEDQLDTVIRHVQAALSIDVARKADSVFTERALAALINDTVLFGRLDLLMLKGAKAYVIDWKTTALTPEQMSLEVSRYELQMRGYAWLTLATMQVSEVQTTLIFTDLIARTADHRADMRFTRKDEDSLRAELIDAITSRQQEVWLP